MKENELRKLANKELAKDLFVIWHLQKVNFWQTDIFGVFDFIAINPFSGKSIFVQLTTLSNASKRRNKISQWLYANNLEKFTASWLWLWDEKTNSFRKENLILPDNGV